MSHSPIEPSDSEVDDLIRDNPGGMDLLQIAHVLGCSKQRVTQLLDRALAKVHKELRWRQLKPDDIIPFG